MLYYVLFNVLLFFCDFIFQSKIALQPISYAVKIHAAKILAAKMRTAKLPNTATMAWQCWRVSQEAELSRMPPDFSAKSRGRLSVVKVQVSQTQRYKILVLGFLDWHKLLSDPSQNMVEKSFKPLPGSPKYFLTALTLACQKWHQRNVTAMDSYLQLHLQEPSVLTCRMLLWKSIIKWQIVQKQPSNRSTSIYLKPTGRQALNLNSGIQNKWAIIFWKPYFRQ